MARRDLALGAPRLRRAGDPSARRDGGIHRSAQASFTIALNTARDQIIQAAGIIAETSTGLIGAIGRAILADPMPGRRTRISPHVVKRAISKHRAKGQIDHHSHPATITIGILTAPELTTAQAP